MKTLDEQLKAIKNGDECRNNYIKALEARKAMRNWARVQMFRIKLKEVSA